MQSKDWSAEGKFQKPKLISKNMSFGGDKQKRTLQRRDDYDGSFWTLESISDEDYFMLDFNREELVALQQIIQEELEATKFKDKRN